MDRDELIGSYLGQYQVLERLGEGGMARVYKAIQPRLKRTVALKVILPEAAARPGFRERFEREAQLIARLQHANIVAVYDFGETHNLSYLVMQYVGGGTLSGKLKSGQPLPYTQAVNYAAQMARALHHAHSQGIIHRDIKPSNMLLDEKDANHVLLSDFGIAKLLSSAAESEQGQMGAPQPLTTTGSIIGTPEFMAPEQAQGTTIDARTDIYALGMVLYMLLTGILPFRASTPLGVLYQQVHTAPPPVTELNPAVPPALAEVLNHALAKQPEARFQSAEAFARALEGVLFSASQIDAAPTLLAEPGPTLLAPGVIPQAPGAPSISRPGSLSGGYTTQPQPITSPATPTQISATRAAITPPGMSAPSGAFPQAAPGGASAIPGAPAGSYGFHTAATPLPGQARGVVAPTPTRTRRPTAVWLVTGASLLVVVVVVLVIRGPFSPFAVNKTPTPSSTGSIPVSTPVIDNFKENDNGWPTGHINGDPGLNWTVGNGVYDLTIPVGSAYKQSYFSTPANLGQPPTNFTLEVKVRQVRGSVVLGYGLIFREAVVTQNQQQLINSYAFTINSNGQYEFQVYHLSQGGAPSFSTPPPGMLKAGLNQINDLKVVVAGNTFKLYANGQLLPGPNADNSRTKTDYASGAVGLLITGDGAAPQEYQFSSFVLTPTS
jgi:serine/threonine protein kinase